MASQLRVSPRYAGRALHVSLPGELGTAVDKFVLFQSDGLSGATETVDNTLADQLVADYPFEVELVSQT